jgi:hypothetical protein
MVRPNMRTSPNQPILSRPIKAKHSLKSNLSDFSSNKSPVSIPRYITRTFPDHDVATRRAMVAAVERYLATDEGKRYGMPSETMLRQPNGILEGLIS